MKFDSATVTNAHYHLENDRLMEHWKISFGENVFNLDYDSLVKDPEAVLREALDFLGLPWDARFLDFQRVDTMVKTASVWQVRDGLYQASSGRWRNYEPLVEGIRALFPEACNQA